MGLGKKLAIAFGHLMKDKFGVTHILFKESSKQPAYPYFFANTLKAKKQGTSNLQEWLWTIP